MVRESFPFSAVANNWIFLSFIIDYFFLFSVDYILSEGLCRNLLVYNLMEFPFFLEGFVSKEPFLFFMVDLPFRSPVSFEHIFFFYFFFLSG
jgi:hypothetical protein